MLNAQNFTPDSHHHFFWHPCSVCLAAGSCNRWASNFKAAHKPTWNCAGTDEDLLNSSSGEAGTFSDAAQGLLIKNQKITRQKDLFNAFSVFMVSAEPLKKCSNSYCGVH